jgi:hypothetical protein
VQSGGALARMWIFRKHIQWKILGMFLLAFVPCAILGTFVWVQLISLAEWQPYIKMWLAFYIILFVVFGHSIRVSPSGTKRLMLSGGMLAGFGSMTLGAVAPLMAPFFIALNLNKNEFSGTWTVAAFIANVSKIPLLFIIWNQVSPSHGALVFLLFIGSFIGAYLGKSYLTGPANSFLGAPWVHFYWLRPVSCLFGMAQNRLSLIRRIFSVSALHLVNLINKQITFQLTRLGLHKTQEGF